MIAIKKLSKDEYHSLATAGARALLVEMKAKELSLLDSFPDLKATMEGFPKLRGRTQGKIASRAESAARVVWALKQGDITPDLLVKKFFVTNSNASQMLLIWCKKGLIKRVSPGHYKPQKLLKAA